ncbi:MAG: methylmalonyl Co-A mutase-associated GTPase MeaB [Candidatus Tectomicrobia bacterium]|nr:methylmalonyl Co-A mutase-associated GTPase MeaB [Candidatus Tectomicrobia bacterium]
MHEELAEKVTAGSIRAAARLITLVENRDPAAREVMKSIHRAAGKAQIWGFTGPPGAGKSTLVDAVTTKLREQGKTVGIIAIDPTSPFTGGAILGDRIRMNRHSLDEGVFIRSMATRGHLGGLTRATVDAVNILDALGRDVVMIETVGVGQDEVDIVKTAHTSVVILVPTLGDDIQAMKAGILEIGDVFLINKADLDGATRTQVEIEMMLDLAPRRAAWRPPVLKTIANAGEGITETLEAIARHRDYLLSSNELGAFNRRRSEWELLGLLQEQMTHFALAEVLRPGDLDRHLDAITARQTDPFSVIDEIITKLRRGGSAAR